MSAHTTKCHAVYLDDNPDEIFLFQRAIQDTQVPLRIQPFFTAGPAIAYLKGEPPYKDRETYPLPCFLLCDYALGGVFGSDVVESVRELAECEKLPTIIYSDFDADETVTRCYDCGADHFLCKPVDVARLRLIVHTFYKCASDESMTFAALKELAEYRAGSKKLNQASGK